MFCFCVQCLLKIIESLVTQMVELHRAADKNDFPIWSSLTFSFPPHSCRTNLAQHPSHCLFFFLSFYIIDCFYWLLYGKVQHDDVQIQAKMCYKFIEGCLDNRMLSPMEAWSSIVKFLLIHRSLHSIFMQT